MDSPGENGLATVFSLLRVYWGEEGTFTADLHPNIHKGHWWGKVFSSKAQGLLSSITVTPGKMPALLEPQCWEAVTGGSRRLSKPKC